MLRASTCAERSVRVRGITEVKVCSKQPSIFQRLEQESACGIQPNLMLSVSRFTKTANEGSTYSI
ncbi:MAG: hypothetical protein QGG71_18240 [Pirellulaceae bacterium]|nr:hypothetical protein [Pirellulaceae bacterium]